MQKNPDQYQPYIDEPVQSYVRSKIEPAMCEMEEVGLSAMIAVLVSPAGLAAEVHYLDRSPGETINTIQYGWGGSERPATKIRLLYRPGHYDILYKAEDLITPKAASQPQQQNVFTVALQHSHSETLHHRTPFQADALEIPMGSFFNPAAASWPQAIGQYDFAPSPMSPAVTSPRTVVTPSYPGVPSVPVHDMYFQSTQMPQSTMGGMTLPHHVQMDRGNFRPSHQQYFLDISHAQHQSLCQTAIFRKYVDSSHPACIMLTRHSSHYNTAHFNNPDFEPEQWHPENDYASTDRPRKKSSHSN